MACLQNGGRGLVHLRHHLALVLAILEFDARDRNAVIVDAGVVHGDAVVGVGQHFAVRMQRDQRGVALADGGLEVGAEAGNLFGPTGAIAGAAAPELHAEAAQVIALAAVAMIEARHVDVLAADAIVVLHRRAEQLRHEAEHVQAHLLAQIAADHVGRIADAVGMAARFRVQQNAGRVDARGGDDHHARAHACAPLWCSDRSTGRRWRGPRRR